jgi:glycosyltransferase involved in cell wall biosynthesis
LARHVDVPVALQVATLTTVERDGQHVEASLPRRLWYAGMTRLVSRMEQTVPSIVDAIFVENTWMCDHFRERAEDGKVHFAPPGIDTDLYHPGDPAAERGDYILSVGRLGDSRKNVGLLFEAYHRLKEQQAHVPRLVLAGLSGPTERDWARAEALGIREDIEMYENVSEERLAELYRGARLFVLSSNEEGLGLVLAEAMASGTPVVSTDCGGPSTLIKDGDTGVLVPTGDAAALADRMLHVLTHPDKAVAMGQAGRERVENEFSISAAGERFLRVYDELLA